MFSFVTFLFSSQSFAQLPANGEATTVVLIDAAAVKRRVLKSYVVDFVLHDLLRNRINCGSAADHLHTIAFILAANHNHVVGRCVVANDMVDGINIDERSKIAVYHCGGLKHSVTSSTQVCGVDSIESKTAFELYYTIDIQSLGSRKAFGFVIKGFSVKVGQTSYYRTLTAALSKHQCCRARTTGGVQCELLAVECGHLDRHGAVILAFAMLAVSMTCGCPF